MQFLVLQLETCVDTPSCASGNYDVFFEEDKPQCPHPLVVPDRDPDITVTGEEQNSGEMH